MEKTNNDPIRILIIDDHQLFNDGLSSVLSSNKTLQIVEQIYDSRLVIQKIEEINPDVILTDFNMPHLNGIELTKMLLDKNSDYKIIILSMYNDERHIESFKKAKAKGYLCKNISPNIVFEAIETVFNGGCYFPETDDIKIHSEDHFIKKLKLSQRELEVIEHIKEGLQTKEIADKLNISYYTAETHRKNIKLKMGLKGEAEFLKFIYES